MTIITMLLAADYRVHDDGNYGDDDDKNYDNDDADGDCIDLWEL